jgi:hypothetical protein
MDAKELKAVNEAMDMMSIFDKKEIITEDEKKKKSETQHEITKRNNELMLKMDKERNETIRLRDEKKKNQERIKKYGRYENSANREDRVLGD